MNSSKTAAAISKPILSKSWSTHSSISIKSYWQARFHLQTITPISKWSVEDTETKPWPSLRSLLKTTAKWVQLLTRIMRSVYSSYRLIFKQKLTISKYFDVSSKPTSWLAKFTSSSSSERSNLPTFAWSCKPSRLLLYSNFRRRRGSSKWTRLNRQLRSRFLTARPQL